MHKKIRILFAICTMSGGGAERQVLGILKHLNRAKFEPMLYLVNKTGELLTEIPDDVPVFAFDQRHPQPPRLKWFGRMHTLRARDMADVMREQQIDLVYDRTYHMTLISAPATALTKTKRISVVANDPKQDLVNYELRFGFIKRKLLKKAYRTADVVLTVSEGVRKSMLDFYQLTPSQVRTIYSPIDVARIDRLVEEQVEPISDSEFHVVSSGRLHPQKGHQFLIEAAHELIINRKQTQLRFHVLGEGLLREELLSLICNLGLDEYLFLDGFQENPFTLLSQTQLFCLPSLFEGLPNALLEAMACRVPVLSTDCPSGPSEILNEGEYGKLVPPSDSMALANAIEDALLNYDQWQALIPAARKRVEDIFGLEQRIKELEELFESVHSQNNI